MAAAQTSAAMPAHRIDFIDEDDARRVLFALLKQISNAAGADAYEHLDEVRTGNRKEGDIRFAGDRPGEQRLACARRTHQQHTLRDASSQLLESSRLAQEFDNLLQFLFSFLNP